MPAPLPAGEGGTPDNPREFLDRIPLAGRALSRPAKRRSDSIRSRRSSSVIEHLTAFPATTHPCHMLLPWLCSGDSIAGGSGGSIAFSASVCFGQARKGQKHVRC